MNSQYCAGSVWSFRHDYGDGEDRKKYFILLADCPKDSDVVLAAVTTSKGRRFHGFPTKACGCPQFSVYRIDPELEPCFRDGTWVVFSNEAPIAARAQLDALATAGRARFVQSLENERTRSILNCATKSLDIAKRDEDLIRRTLKAMNEAAKLPPRPAKKTALLSDNTPMGIARRRFERNCVKCQNDFAGLLKMSIEEVTLVFSGKKRAPANFLTDADDGLDLLDGKICPCKEQ